MTKINYIVYIKNNNSKKKTYIILWKQKKININELSKLIKIKN